MKSETKKPKTMKQGKPDDFQTPIIALYPLIPHLKKHWLIWECAEGKGNLTKELERLGFRVFGSDILTGINFLEYDLDKYEEDFCIITNPPYSLKEKFLERCYEFGKPFALLLPLSTLESETRHKLFRKFGIQLIIPNKRIAFETPDGRYGKTSIPWFQAAWFCYGLNLPKDIMFVELNDLKQTKIEF